MSIESNRNDLERVKHELHEINVRDIGSADPIFTFDPDAEIDSDDEIDNEKTINVYLNDLMTRIFPELEGLDPELLSRIREKIDKAVHATGQANITEIFDMLKRTYILYSNGAYLGVSTVDMLKIFKLDNIIWAY